MLRSTLSNFPHKIKRDSTLGNLTKSPHPPAEETGLKVSSRYRLQDTARQVLKGNHRVKNCCRAHLKGKDEVSINSYLSGGFGYGNLQKCGSVWVCPVCAAKIVAFRRSDLSSFIDRSGAAGASISMLTLTVPHGYADTLSATLDQIGKAKELMQHRKTWKSMATRIGLIGQVRTLEVTHGKNGWHPHFHILLFTDRPLQGIGALTQDILAMWQSACSKVGAAIPNAHGVSIKRTRKNVADYVQKWGIDYEMTSGPTSKKGLGGRTPFQLLEAAGEDRQAAKLFQEYADCFRGKRQLVFSKGLRALYGFDNQLSDEEILEAGDLAPVPVAAISLSSWRVIVRRCLRGEVLAALHNGKSLSDINRFLEREGVGSNALLLPVFSSRGGLLGS